MIKKKLLILIFIVLGFNANAETINNIIIEGNKRISDQTIVMFSNIEKGNIINNSQELNLILKNLYETEYFSDVKLKFENNTIYISVIENPIIQSIQIKGLKAKKFKEAVLDTIKMKEKSSFVKQYLDLDVERIKSALKRSGYYFSDVEVQSVNNDNNSIDLIYSINLGEKAKIRKINFIGEKIFKDRKLRKIIVSEEYKFWKFISSKKFLNQDLLNLDTRLLKNFYLNRGYFNVVVSNSFVEYLDNNEFDITYSIDSGKKIYFKEFSLNIPDEYEIKKFNKVKKLFKKLENKPYSINSVEKISKVIENISLLNKYEFLSVSINEEIYDKNKLKFSIDITEEKIKYYVNRINIYGNDITNENVIRNQLIVDEGDALNNLLFNKSINNIKSLNIFENVSGKVVESEINGKKNIEINVEEKATGEISAGAGVGSSGGSIGFGIKENNYLGKGIILDANLNLNEEAIKGSLDYYNPNYKDTDKSLTFGISSTATDRLSEFGYKSSDTSFFIGTRYEQYENLFFRPDISITYDKIETSNSASSALKKQKGDYFAFKFNHELDFDKRNRKYQPTSGNRQRFSQSIPIYSKTYALRNSYNLNQYYDISENITAGLSLYGSMITSLKSNNDVRISERIYIPQSRLRGFEPGKIGPVDGGDYVGGNYATSLNINSDLPIFNNNQSTDFKIFFDAANLWGADFKSNDGAGSKIRTSTGIALDWFTPVGPLNFSLTQPITKKDTDKTESFRFNIGTTF